MKTPRHLLLLLTACACVAAFDPFPLEAATAIYQEGTNDPFTLSAYTGTQDDWLVINSGSGATDQNLGADARIIVGGGSGGSVRHGLIRFDVSSLAGHFVSIDSVTLRLFWNQSSGAGDTVRVYPFAVANADWTEGAGFSGNTASTGESTWAFKHYSTTSWAGSAGASTAGTDYVNSELAHASYIGSETGGTSFDLAFNGTAIINQWLSGTNAGLFLRTDTELNQAIFRSSEFAGFQPELIIAYTPTPEPVSEMLVVVGLVIGSSRRWRTCGKRA